MNDGSSRLIACACAATLLAVWAPEGAAQATFKCKDDRGRLTYSNVNCDKQGLKDAGPVADRTTTLPMGPAQKVPPTAAKPAAAKDDSEIGPMQAPAQIKPVNPLIEKLLK